MAKNIYELFNIEQSEVASATCDGTYFVVSYTDGGSEGFNLWFMSKVKEVPHEILTKMAYDGIVIDK
jgi:hypothetical protein